MFLEMIDVYFALVCSGEVAMLFLFVQLILYIILPHCDVLYVGCFFADVMFVIPDFRPPDACDKTWFENFNGQYQVECWCFNSSPRGWKDDKYTKKSLMVFNGCLGRLAMKGELTIIFMSTRQSKCREQNLWRTVIHWYKSADTGSGLAWNNESFPLSLYKNGQHLDSPKAIPPKNTLLLCGMPGSSCEQSIQVVSTVVSLLNTGTPQKTDMTMKKTPIWRCTSYWKWWFSSQPCLLEGIPHLFRCIKRKKTEQPEPKPGEVVDVAVSLVEPVVVAIFPWVAAILLDAQVAENHWYPYPETNSQFAPEAMDGWKTIRLPFLGFCLFSGALAVSFRECIL